MGFFKRLLGSNPSNAAHGDEFASLDWPAVKDRAMFCLRSITDLQDKQWGISSAAWQMDQATGRIVFDTQKGYKVSAPCQVAGSYDTKNQTWRWAWANPSIHEPLKDHAKYARTYGQRRGFKSLTTPEAAIREAEAWELAAVTMRLNNVQGVFRCPMGSVLVFVTFGTVEITKADGSPLETSAPPPLPETQLSSEQVPEEVFATVLGYINDYEAWNQDALDQGDMRNLSEESQARITANYQAMTEKWCSQATTAQPYSYGTNSMHAASQESIVGADQQDGMFIVYTRHIDGRNFISDYEYHLVHEHGVWKLRHLFYTDPDGKHECL